MRRVFYPAMCLMGQLRYGAKFVLIGGLSLVVILVLVLVLLSDLRNTMRLTENGLDGLRVLGKVHRVIEFTQQHRGLSSGVLNGNAAMREPRSAKEKRASGLNGGQLLPVIFHRLL